MSAPRPSTTCLYTAAARALGARDPDPAVRNPDYFAERLMGPEERALVSEQACVQALELDYAELFQNAAQNMEALSSALMMQIRTRFIEERLADAVASGATQVVLLGAGFDTRAYRLTELLKDVRVFEVDQPASQEHKRRRIREAGIPVPSNLTYVPVDFRHDRLDTVLRAAGYDSSQVTFFIWEGVTMYLTPEAMEETCRWVGQQAPGSTIIFDYVYKNVIDFLQTVDPAKFPPQMPEAAKQGVLRLLKLEAGEPWLFGIPNGAETEYLKRFGLTVTKLLPIGGEESSQRYLTRSDGSYYVPLPPGMQRPPTGAGASASYCLVEARVGA